MPGGHTTGAPSGATKPITRTRPNAYTAAETQVLVRD